MARNPNRLGSITHVMRNGKKYWIGRVTLGTDISGKQVRKSSPSFKKFDVVEKTREYVTCNAVSGPIDPQKTALGPSLHHRVFSVKSKGVKISALSKYDYNLRLRIPPCPCANIEIKNITVQNLQKLINFLTPDEDWPEGAMDTTLQTIRTFLGYCIILGRIQTNLAKYVKVPGDKDKFPAKETFRTFSEQEQDLTLKALGLSDTAE